VVFRVSDFRLSLRAVALYELYELEAGSRGRMLRSDLPRNGMTTEPTTGNWSPTTLFRVSAFRICRDPDKASEKLTVFSFLQMGA